ncbi:MAG: hypothetical protein KJO20_09445 [Eudoraea sp.]|nr:hypothetical protein [Eudoraea sp.]NNK29927.1 hypothetical protein [Flavobacteriaceae bacterium]
MRCVSGPILWLLCVLLTGALYAQEEKPKKAFLNGYIKNMASLNDLRDSVLADNLVHNRLNFRWYPSEELRVYGALRTRLFVGETTKAFGEDFVDFIEYDTYFFDLSLALYNEGPVLLHTIIDRLYLEWNHKDLSLKAGRQRINWGINTVWNPNDIFNAYSYFDFDYEERPGTDAARLEYFTGVNSSIDVAVSLPAETFDPAGRKINTLSAALMYKTNQWNYDFQFLAGYSRENWVLGAGWAGNLGSASLKGEMTYFSPEEETAFDREALVGTISIDHSIKNLFYNLSYLYNSAGPSELGAQGLLLLGSRSITAKNLSPYRHSAFVQAGYQIHPLVSGGMGVMLFPSNKAVFLSPFLTWNVLQDFDIDLIAQGFYGEDFISGDFRALSVSYFLRGKWSF